VAFVTEVEGKMVSTRGTGMSIAVALVAFLMALTPAAGCGGPGMELSAREVLSHAVEDLLSLSAYRYEGTSEMRFEDDPRLDTTASFETVLVKADNGALDGYMKVDSAGYSYETYSFRGVEYTLAGESGWIRVDREKAAPGYGMVSAGARRIIGEFADLVSDVRFESETPGEYTVSMVMGDRYREGAAAIAGISPSASPGSGDIRMVVVVSKGDLRLRSVWMEDAKPADGDMPAVTTVTSGTYSAFNEPVDVSPPPQALNAPEVDPADAPPTRQIP
jgi:hypothetical protein